MNYVHTSGEEVLEHLSASQEGLTESEAAQRLAQQGKNKLAEGQKKSNFARFVDQLKDPMIFILLAAALLSGAFGEWVDVLVILFVVLLNAVLGMVQESKAEKAIEALQQMSAPHTRVRRDGGVVIVATEDLVTGDIVLLEAGDAVPADLRILQSAGLRIEEAALTGESVAVDKTDRTLELPEEEISGVPAELPLGDRLNMAYMGTNVVYGRGEAVVVGTGMDTEMGKIAAILADTESEKTPLQIKLGSLSKVLSIAVLLICAVIFGINSMRYGFSEGHLMESLMTSVSLAVAAIPEGLVMVVTVLLSIGVTRMSERNAIIRRMTAVETLGCTQVICTDKTGTLTENRMTVVDHMGDELQVAATMAMCSDVQTDPQGGLVGEPTELALVVYAQKLGLSKHDLDHSNPRVGEVPFDSDRKMMTTIHRTPEGSLFQATKGAPDEILAHCSHIIQEGQEVPLTDALRRQVLDKNTEMASRALRVLGVATRQHQDYPAEISSEALEQSMTFVGLTGMIDPVRKEVLDAVTECRRAGIRVVMITGDHRDTAVAIARELGILEHDTQAVTGVELSRMDDEEFNRRIEEISVYARVQPEHKMRIVNTWRAKGRVTSMTGDGVNDAPALKSADIGVGMGITGTDVTKNVADMVLADDNFASIVYAVEEGRRIYENIRKAIQFLLASNLSEVIAIFMATMAGWNLMAPIHILWINLVTDSLPAIALGMEPAEDDAMSRPPRDAKDGIFADGVGVNIIYQGILVAILTLLSFRRGVAVSELTGMTMAFLTLSMCEIFHSINLRSRTKSLFSMHSHNRYLTWAMLAALVLTLGVIYIPGINDAFSLVALPLNLLGYALGLAVAVIPVVELVKLVQRGLIKGK